MLMPTSAPAPLMHSFWQVPPGGGGHDPVRGGADPALVLREKHVSRVPTGSELQPDTERLSVP